MVLTSYRIFPYLLGMLICSNFLAACSPEELAIEVSPTTLTTAQISQPEPSRAALEPTYTPRTSSPAAIPTLASLDQLFSFVVCDETSAGTSATESSNQQEGIPVEIDRLIPPAPPARASVGLTGDRVKVTWQGTGTDVDQSYNLYVQNLGEECWELVGMEPVEGDNEGLYSFEFTNGFQEASLHIGLTTVDIYGNESSLAVASGTGARP